jgi:hypothetical protein
LEKKLIFIIGINFKSEIFYNELYYTLENNLK